MSVDTVGNFLTIIRNGVMASKKHISDSFSALKYEIAQILKEEGFVKDILVETNENNLKRIKVVLKYVNGESVIHNIDRVSTPGRRVYKGSNEVEPVIGGLGIAILSTNQGVMTNKKAKQLIVGGEVICTVW